MASAKRLSKALNIDDLQKLANRALPSPIRNYLEGGADDEWTMARNRAAFDDYVLSPRALVDVSNIDTSTEIFGTRSALPLILSPTGMSQLFHATGEVSVARAARDAGLLYGLSTMATTSIEDVAKIAPNRYFQLYLFKDLGLTKALLERAWANGYVALALTTDTKVGGNRERDIRTGMTMPPKFGLGSLVSFALHPEWSLGALRHPNFELANVVDQVGQLPKGTRLADYINTQFDRSATWKGLEWLRANWPGKLAVKGVMAPDDCLTAVECGADAIMLSNHGGRQLDGVAAPVDVLPAARDRIGRRAQLIVDGGVRRGVHVVKALALGADACSIGRPYLYGLAAGGEAGVRRALEIFRSEIERGMALLGRSDIGSISTGDVQRLQALLADPTTSSRKAKPPR